MKVRTQDAIAFYKYKLEQYEVQRIELESKYAQAKEEYESRFLSKLFKCKYEDSREGDRADRVILLSYWGFSDLERYEKDAKATLNKLSYHEKVNDYHVELDSYINQFYNWANENNITY